MLVILLYYDLHLFMGIDLFCFYGTCTFGNLNSNDSNWLNGLMDFSSGTGCADKFVGF